MKAIRLMLVGIVVTAIVAAVSLAESGKESPPQVANAPACKSAQSLVEESPELVVTLLESLVRFEKAGKSDAAVLVHRTLRRLGPDAIPALIKIMEDENSPLRGMALMALGRFVTPRHPGREALPIVLKMLKDKDDQVASIAALTLDAIVRSVQQAESGGCGEPTFSTEPPLLQGHLHSIRYVGMDGSEKEVRAEQEGAEKITVYSDHLVIEYPYGDGLGAPVVQIFKYQQIKELILVQ